MGSISEFRGLELGIVTRNIKKRPFIAGHELVPVFKLGFFVKIKEDEIFNPPKFCGGLFFEPNPEK